MSGASIEVQIEGLEAVQARIDQLLRFGEELEPILEAVGATVEAQTRTRLQFDKAAPTGEAWDPWSERYAKTRHGGQSLLQSSGNLVDSIQFVVGEGGEVEVGTNLVYGATHQYGRGKIPARPYLGLSSADAEAVVAVIEDYIDHLWDA